MKVKTTDVALLSLIALATSCCSTAAVAPASVVLFGRRRCGDGGDGATAVCSLCGGAEGARGRLYAACCSQQRVFSLCLASLGSSKADGVDRGAVYAEEYDGEVDAAAADKRYGRMGFGRAAQPPGARRGYSNPGKRAGGDDYDDDPWGAYDKDGRQDDYDDLSDVAALYDDDDDYADDEADKTTPARDRLLHYLSGEKRFGSLGIRGGR